MCRTLPPNFTTSTSWSSHFHDPEVCRCINGMSRHNETAAIVSKARRGAAGLQSRNLLFATCSAMPDHHTITSRQVIQHSPTGTTTAALARRVKPPQP
jgi:hypothetical protein